MLNPLLLWFLPLAIVPLLLHVITLQRLRTVELSTFRFLMDSYVQQRRRMKLLEYLIMLLRIGFIAACVIMLTRPVMQRYAGLFGGRGSGDVAIVMDVGPSMALRTNLTTSLQRAKDAARAIIGLVGDEVRVSIIRAGRDAQLLVSRFGKHREGILDQIEELETDTALGNIATALERVFESDPGMRRNVFIITDGNRNSWSGLENHPVLKRIGPSATIMVIDVGPTEPVANLTAAGEPPQTLRSIVGLPVQLTATIVNNADEPQDTVVSVVLDERQVNRMHLSLTPGQRISQTVSFTPRRTGIIRGRFELPGDDFPDDDAFLFCLNVERPLNVLLLSQGGDHDDSASLRYIRTALESPQHAATNLTEDDMQIAAALHVTSLETTAPEAAVIEAADVVVLADVQLENAQPLRDYVASGGGLLVLPGPGIKPADYNAQLLTPPKGPVGDTAVPPALLEPATGDPDDESAFVPLGTVDLAHPIFSAFDEPDPESFKTVRSYRYYPIRLPEPSSAGPGSDAALARTAAAPATALMRLPDDTPVLVETSIGDGRVLLASVPASPSWSNLPLTGEFVATMLRAVAYLRRPAQATAPVAARPYDLAPIRLTGRWADAHVQATDPAGRAHTVPLTRSGPQLVGAMDQTGRKGYYTYSILPRSEGAPTRLELGFAVNLDARQASLEVFDEAALRSLLTVPDAPQQAKVLYLRGAPGDPVLNQQLQHKREIWRDLIVAAFVVVLIEFLLATLGPGRETTRDRHSFAARPGTTGRWGRLGAIVRGARFNRSAARADSQGH